MGRTLGGTDLSRFLLRSMVCNDAMPVMEDGNEVSAFSERFSSSIFLKDINKSLLAIYNFKVLEQINNVISIPV